MATPVGLTATPGDSVISLKWNAASGATAYNLKRSLVNGGPYTLLAGGLTATNYTDSVVTNGTTYYYVVSAYNACGLREYRFHPSRARLRSARRLPRRRV